uniref:Asteroid domain-containing protein n=1 Tax=Heliothis virescens TaxID=7102 RepID=A0A2A4JZ46_HELVI
MKFTALRHYIRNKNLEAPHTLSDCDLVIDGDSFFKGTYRSSRCQYILGPDCDKYADHIMKLLTAFIDNDVKCYVIFRGVHKYDLEKRKEIHQSIIDDRQESSVDHVEYFTPALVNVVQKQVLEKMDIKYFVCEQDSLGAIVGVARKLKCPVLTDNLEYSLFGVSCIPTNSVQYHNSATKLKCEIYGHEEVKTAFGVYNKMPVVLALFNESGDYLDSLKQVIQYVGSDVVGPVVRWVKRQREATLFSKIANSIDDEDQNRIFKEVYEKIQIIYCYPLCNLAVKYFQRDKAHDLLRDDKKWLAKAVACGRIALPYVTLRKHGFVCGSTLMFDGKQPDALLPAMDIIAYSHCLLTNSQVSKITFLERKGKKCSVKKIETFWDRDISNRDLFTKYRVGKKLKTTTPQAFDLFLEEVLPGYKFENLLLSVPEDCRILIITLVYYIVKKNKDFVNGAYCILLSYFMLGRVSKNVDSLQKKLLSPGSKDSEVFYNRLQFLFEKVNLKLKYDSAAVHSFSEFIHCLQHMNYLNKLCGEKIRCTIFHETYNATFIYNTYLFMKDRNHLINFLVSKFGDSVPMKKFKNIIDAFENCLSVKCSCD